MGDVTAGLVANPLPLPSGSALGDWNSLFQQRRHDDYPAIPDPLPVYNHITYTRELGLGLIRFRRQVRYAAN